MKQGKQVLSKEYLRNRIIDNRCILYNPGMKNLPKLFSEYNRIFFRGRLPAYQVRYFDIEPQFLRGLCDTKNRTIFIHREITGEELKQLLLHEMCHIGAPYHGQKFLKRLQRLADLGEEWASEEIELHKNAPSWNQLMAGLRNTISDWSFEVDDSVTFDEILPYLAYEVNMSSEELLKSAPWARAAWENARKEAKIDRDYQELFKRST